MNILLRIFIALFCVGCFFSTALCNIGFLGATGLLVLELFFDSGFRRCFVKFHRTHKIWVPTIYLLLLNLLEIRWNASDLAIRWSIACKYLRFGTVLVFVPGFLYHRRSLDFLFHAFGLTAFVWCLFHAFYDSGVKFFINPIIISVFIAYLCIYYAVNVLRRKNVFLNLIKLMYFSIYLLCLNSEKTGVFMTALLELLLLIFVVFFVDKKTWKQRMLAYTYVSICFAFAWGVSFYENRPLAQRLKNVTLSSSVFWRVKMTKESVKIIKDHLLFGSGTGGYRQELIKNNFDFLGKEASIHKKPHPHNEWLLWLIQWGVWGLLGLILWFGYNFIYFLRGFRIKLLEKTEMVYRLLGICLTVGIIVAGGCDSVFASTVLQSFYLLVLCACISKVYTLRKSEIRS